jgi:hypothetical protein
MIICIGLGETTDVYKIAFRKYLQANRFDEQRSLLNTPSLSLSASSFLAS